eukprot:m.136916 g.136916  ORF g.136916 m.136916 type:complete len:56 (-) comp11059_c0_seq1:2440-2607(-)
MKNVFECWLSSRVTKQLCDCETTEEKCGVTVGKVCPIFVSVPFCRSVTQLSYILP